MGYSSVAESMVYLQPLSRNGSERWIRQNNAK